MPGPTRTTVTILASVSVAAGGTKTSPASGGTGSWVDIRSYNGGQFGWTVTNGASAPTIQGQFTLQASDDGTNNIVDIWSGGGSLVASDTQTGFIEVANTVSYVRMLAYGNTGQAVTFKGMYFARS